MRKWIVVAAGLAMLAVVNATIYSRERLVESGRVVLLELATVDPRSLMQGDYMALRFRVAGEATARVQAGSSGGYLVLLPDARGVAGFRRLDDGSPLTGDELRLRYRVRDGTPKLATDAWFFEEGRASEFARARFGEFRVAADGEAILVGLRDASLAPLRGNARR